MRRELGDLVGSGLLLAALALATTAALAPTPGAGVASSSGDGTPPSRGEALFFAKGCVGCHRIASVNPDGPLLGPDLTSLELRAATQRPGLSAEEYVRESIRTPSAFVAAVVVNVQMPDLGLSDDEIDALVAFLLDPEN